MFRMSRKSKGTTKSFAKSLGWPSAPWERIHIDFAGPFMGNMFLIVVDALSKWPEVHVMNSITASKTIDVLRQIFAQFEL